MKPRRCPRCDAPVLVASDRLTLDDRAETRGEPHRLFCRECDVTGCEERYEARGLCRIHLIRSTQGEFLEAIR